MNDTVLYNTLKRMIERHQTNGIEAKLDFFYASNKLTTEHYQELIGMLNGNPA